MNFLEHLILHVSHSLVVRILASGAGGLGFKSRWDAMWHSRRMTMETMGHVCCDKSIGNKLNFFDYLQSKMSFPFIEISTNIC